MFATRFMLVLLAVVTLTPPVSASPYSSVVVYGDSLSDNGNLYALAGLPGAPYYQGRRSDGPVAVEYLAQSLGVPLVDFAWIGATTGVGNYADNGNVTAFGSFNLPGMTTLYNATQASLSPYVADGLFVVWGGPNDILAPSPSDATPADIIARAVADEVTIIANLQAKGVNTILAPGMPDLGLTPDYRLAGQAALGTAITNAFNTALAAALPAGVLYFDTAALTRAVTANPAAYGLTNATDACYSGSGPVCANPENYLYFDQFHPTTATHALIAEGFLAAVLPEPSTLALMAAGLVLLLAARGRAGKAQAC